MYDTDVFRREMLGAGQRLLEALDLEDKFTRLYRERPKEEVLREVREARRLVDRSQNDYDAAVSRYRDAVRGSLMHSEERRPKKTVLLLEDDAMISRLLQGMLEQSGCQVLAARDGKEAAALSQNHEGEIHLLIADVILRSGPDGIEIAERLRELRPDVPVLFISGHPQEQLENRGLLVPGTMPFPKSAFLQKPFSPATLEEQVRRLIAGSSSY